MQVSHYLLSTKNEFGGSEFCEFKLDGNIYGVPSELLETNNPSSSITLDELGITYYASKDSSGLRLTITDHNEFFDEIILPNILLNEYRTAAIQSSLAAHSKGPRTEYNIRMEGKLSNDKLRSLNAECISVSTQLDSYFFTSQGEVWRIREESGTFILSKKSANRDGNILIWEDTDEVISQGEAKKLFKEGKVVAKVEKQREMFSLDNVFICVDDVAHLGGFTQFRAFSREALNNILKMCGLEENDCLQESYYELTVAKNHSKIKSYLIRNHSSFSELVTGITTGTMAPFAMLCALSTGYSSSETLLKLLVSYAVADGGIEAYGIASSEFSDRSKNLKDVAETFIKTLAGKALMPLSYVPIVINSTPSNVQLLSGIWCCLVLSLVSAEQAIATQRNILKAIAVNIGIALSLSAFSAWVSSLL